jgi:uncharacterized protein (TIGR01777 family)
MRVAVTGSSGLIGSALVRALQRRGDEVTSLVRPSSGRSGVYWDPRTGQIDRAGLEGMDAVVHLAGENIFSPWTEKQKRRIRDSRVQGTALLATTLAQLQRPPQVLVSGSAVGFYGNRPPDQPIDETAGKGDGFLADVVAAWEAAAQPARDGGIRVTHPRLGLVLTKQGGALKTMLPVFYLGLGGRLGAGQQIWSWVTLADVVGSLIYLLDRPIAGAVNVTAPNPVSNQEFTRTLARLLHRPAFMHVPASLLETIGGPAEELILYGVRAVPRKLVESGYAFKHPDLGPALRSVLAGDVAT